MRSRSPLWCEQRFAGLLRDQCSHTIQHASSGVNFLPLTGITPAASLSDTSGSPSCLIYAIVGHDEC
ncbi:hypothetical protein NITLEN_90084 [Nitrospira lenta]|uniref:Uncharacterized protein n=1 Tax=Nitrospira lenta TaxID=1436998 RepID=A0A330LA07_9BACT|nr:hypothetical protein NITLEN_90084 [Nitrospira lenta]